MPCQFPLHRCSTSSHPDNGWSLHSLRFSAPFTLMELGLSLSLSRVGEPQPPCEWVNNIYPPGFLEYLVVISHCEQMQNQQRNKKTRDLGKGIFKLFHRATLLFKKGGLHPLTSLSVTVAASAQHHNHCVASPCRCLLRRKPYFLSREVRVKKISNAPKDLEAREMTNGGV